MISTLFDKLDSTNLTLIALMFAVAAPTTLMAVVGIVADAWRKAARSRHEADLKRAMIERGFSADEIARVISAGTPDAAPAPPCACEAVVEQDGEWVNALILARAEGQFYAHVVGTEMDDNAWFPADRVRLPVPARSEADANQMATALVKPSAYDPDA